ncbi:MAG TPA: preprotein translocase subunit YajC [Planctomycetaceae bacterium]|nr:preprotein translocase subunit YajC [Planctomycetaceae bacterium]
MTDWFSALVLFAQDAPQQPNAAPPPEGNPFSLMLPALFLILIVWMFMFTGPGAQRRREQKRVTDLLSTLKKNDPVVTIGGIMGTVVNVALDRQEVTIKVDENTRLRMRASAIQGLVGGEKSDESKDMPAAR